MVGKFIRLHIKTYPKLLQSGTRDSEYLDQPSQRKVVHVSDHSFQQCLMVSSYTTAGGSVYLTIQKNKVVQSSSHSRLCP